MVKKRAKLFFKIAVTAALLYYLISLISYKELLEVIERADLAIIFAVFILTIFNVYLQFLKWKTVSSSLLNMNSNTKIAKSLFLGFTGGIITPVRVGEYLGRKIPLEEISLVKVTISTLIDKFASLYFVLLIGSIVSVSFLSNYYSFYLSIPLIVFLIIIIFISVSVYRKDNRFQFLINKLPQNYKFLRDLKTELEYVNKMDSNSIRILLRYSLILYAVIVFQYALLAISFEPNGDLILFLGAGCMIFFVKSFLSFISFADLGIRESTSVLILNNLGYTSAVGFNSAFFLFIFNLVLPSLVGVFLFLKHNSKLRNE